MLRVFIAATLLTSAVAAGPKGPDAFGQPLGFTLREVRLQEVERVLGPALKKADQSFVCYVGLTSGVLYRFLLGNLNPNDIQGPIDQRIVTGFTMRALGDRAAAPCAVLPGAVEARTTPAVGGLALGMTREDAITLLGAGPASPDGRIFRRFSGPERTLVITAQFEGDSLAELTIQAGLGGQDPASLAERFFRGVYGCDASVVRELASPAVVVTYPIFADVLGTPVLHGVDAVEAFAERFCTKWAEPEVTVHESLADGRRVVLVWSFSARDTTAGPGASRSSWGGMTLFRFDDEGRITAEIGEESTPGPMGRIEESPTE